MPVTPLQPIAQRKKGWICRGFWADPAQRRHAWQHRCSSRAAPPETRFVQSPPAGARCRASAGYHFPLQILCAGKQAVAASELDVADQGMHQGSASSLRVAGRQDMQRFEESPWAS
ncbi:hypothetical protein XAP6164_980007 [Xanthomonas phaseoli pv. phaseoli]|nr:hypothetical protein XAP6164_980007 [Xanthomonas phaseoli pv. phaseoli]